eukprot:TRINITY_DN66658_c1_g3_i1.p1 TRINITY_DN66658_c1_g3~~TRINITY_DN66658_c1_g3_i1.p1  ORF type:complete len:275 (-),score=6.93 TRINITY_DN66658_c1_g3_i1:469-1293(-)
MQRMAGSWAARFVVSGITVSGMHYCGLSVMQMGMRNLMDVEFGTASESLRPYITEKVANSMDIKKNSPAFVQMLGDVCSDSTQMRVMFICTVQEQFCRVLTMYTWGTYVAGTLFGLLPWALWRRRKIVNTGAEPPRLRRMLMGSPQHVALLTSCLALLGVIKLHLPKVFNLADRANEIAAGPDQHNQSHDLDNELVNLLTDRPFAWMQPGAELALQSFDLVYPLGTVQCGRSVLSARLARVAALKNEAMQARQAPTGEEPQAEPPAAPETVGKT